MLTLQGRRVCSLAYSPNSRLLATGGADRIVRLWDLSTRQETAAWKGHRTYVHAVAFSSDGQRLVSAGGNVYLRDLTTQCAAVALHEPGSPAAALALTPDDHLLITACRRLGGANTPVAGDVRFWDAVPWPSSASGVKTLRRQGPIPIASADPGPDEVALGRLLRAAHAGAWCIALDPAGLLLAVGTDSGGVFLWDVPAAQLRSRLPTTAAVRSLAFSSDGYLLAAAEASRVQVWEVATGGKVASLQGHTKQVWSVAFFAARIAAHVCILSGSQDGTVRLWDLNTARERNIFRWPLGVVRTVAVAPDGMTAAAGGDEGGVVVWDCDS